MKRKKNQPKVAQYNCFFCRRKVLLHASMQGNRKTLMIGHLTRKTLKVFVSSHRRRWRCIHSAAITPRSHTLILNTFLLRNEKFLVDDSFTPHTQSTKYSWNKQPKPSWNYGCDSKLRFYPSCPSRFFVDLATFLCCLFKVARAR